MRSDLDWLHIDITDDIEDLMKGERGNSIVIENNWQEKEKVIRSYDDVRGTIDAHTVDSEIKNKLAACETNCPHCLLSNKDCHKHNFGEYCSKKVKHYFQLFPTAMTCEKAREHFIKHYHAALHVLIWVKYDHFADESTIVTLPNCLHDTMEDVLNEVDDAHNNIYRRHDWRNITDWKDFTMDFDGTDVGRN